MTRFSEKIRLSSLVVKPTRFLSQKLTLLSLSSFRLCKSLARFLLSKTLSFLSMDNFLADHDDYFWDLDSRPQRRFFREQEPHLENEPLYLVLYRWWKEVEGDADRVESVRYTVTTNSDSDSEIVLHLRKEDNHEEIINTEMGSSGRQYALIPEGLWLRALKRCCASNNAVKDFGSLFYAEDCLLDLFPLQVRIFVSWETNSLVAKISQKENTVDLYKKACDIFSSDYNPVHILDLSGQTSQFFINDSMSPGQDGRGVLLELQVHGLSDSIKGNGSNEIFADRSPMGCSSHSGSVMMNGTTHNVNSYVRTANSFRRSSYSAVGSLGLAGLQNLGNTCFMNSAIQCLVHTPKLVDFFLGDYRKEINYENPLGMNGELALAFGDLLRKLWVPGARPVAPRMFKMKLADFAPQFGGYNQHDSQELLAFLLDGLHEDLNRVKRKPYHEVKDADGRPDEEVAEEYWRNHLARNDSIIVDLCQGQFRSTLVCPVCKKVSITFDPFMYLSLPLPSTMMRTITLTVLRTDGFTLPSTFTITLPKSGLLVDLIEALGTACSLRDDETLLVAEIYKNRICRLLEEPSDSLALIRDEDKLVAYRLPKDNEASPLVVFMHQQVTKHYSFGREKYVESLFGIPIVARLPSVSCGYDIRREFLKLINPFLMCTEDILDEYDDDDDDDVDIKVNEDNELGDATISAGLESDSDLDLEADFKFYLPSTLGMENVKIKMNKPLPFTVLPKKLEVTVLWSDKMIKKYDTCLLSSLPEVFKPQLFTKRTQESVSVYKCLDAFLKEEPLGPEDMWYCPRCKKPQQATKKLDLWRLPEILVVHLKRFSFSRYFKNKLETFVDFPINDLDLSTYVAHKNSHSSNHYELYAISCHYGGLGGGHYTAFVRYGHDKWYEFDDSRVVPVSKDMIKTSAAYVLFYRRV